MDFAACRDMAPRNPGDEDLFFPRQGRSDQSERAKKICQTCPVIRECEQYRNDLGIRHGVWAGGIRTHGNSNRHHNGSHSHGTAKSS